MDLEEQLRERIRNGGPITFHEYMKTALYDPQLGYYASRVPGGDYLTSPELTPRFGALVATALQSARNGLGEGGFVVTEVGGGSGELAASVAAAFEGPLVWRFVEPMPRIRAMQSERLAGSAISARWITEIGLVDPAAGAVLVNEVIDNLPVHLFEVADGEAAEVFVGWDGLRFVETPASPSVDAPEIHRAASLLEDGDRFEWCPDISSFARDAGRALERGYLFVFDYGDTEPDVWTRRPSGTVVTYASGELGTDPLVGPGTRDITAHVDFTALHSALESAGLRVEKLTTQREFLTSLGAREEAEALRDAERRALDEGRSSDAVTIMSERGRLGALTAAGGLGDLKVLIASKNAPPFQQHLGEEGESASTV